ncbi:MAG: hypothetical protein V2I57_11410 [Xanthomonadales bacterium]|jgi:hypothetical protein|nr:hypothetical protein [Xanthomonadales bacterium]
MNHAHSTQRPAAGRRASRGVTLALTAVIGLTLAGTETRGQELFPWEEDAVDTEIVLEPRSLESLAAAADLVALVQVLDTDYETKRDFPVGGTAFLRILIPYKLDRPRPDIIEVYDEGLRPNTCYFPNPEVTEEGSRHLLFVRRNPDVEGQYLGLETGCALTALVTADNRYALRHPPDGPPLTDDLAALARPLEFTDAYAIIDYEDLTVDDRLDLLERGLLEEREDRTYLVTQGIPLSEVRPLLGEENLTRDRSLLRPAPTDGH